MSDQDPRQPQEQKSVPPLPVRRPAPPEKQEASVFMTFLKVMLWLFLAAAGFWVLLYGTCLLLLRR